MGDSGEGLVDAESRIQERIEELQLAREQAKRPRTIANPERVRQLESLKLAYKELSRQFDAARHEARKTQLANAMADIERRIAEIGGAGPS